MKGQVKAEETVKLIERWIDALRSGDYRQANGSLNPAPGRYCCLGVLCEISGIELEDGWGDFSFITYDASLEASEIQGALKEIGISQMILSQLNDHKGYDFQRISDYIQGALDSYINRTNKEWR